MNTKNKQSISVSFQRTNAVPLDGSTVFSSFAEAAEYVNKENTTAYEGQIITVDDGYSVEIYKVIKDSSFASGLDIENIRYFTFASLAAAASGMGTTTYFRTVTEINENKSEGAKAYYKVIILPTTVTRLSNNAFADCTNLKYIQMSPRMKYIHDSAFSNCSKISSMNLPDALTSMGSNAFYNCYSLTSVYINDIAKWCNISFGNLYANPLYYAKKLYLKGELVTNLVIPEGVTSIGFTAFSGCRSLTSVTFAENSKLTSIGKNAFLDCRSLTSITIPNSVTSIGSFAFSDCSSLTSINIPNSVTSIGDEAFNSCSSLTSVTFAENSKLTYIDFATFSGCRSLTSVTIPDSITSIGNFAFSGCYSLTSITIGNSVTSIGQGAFEYCSGFTSINYGGTKAQWKAIPKGSSWNSNTGEYTVICTDGVLTKSQS